MSSHKLLTFTHSAKKINLSACLGTHVQSRSSYGKPWCWFFLHFYQLLVNIYIIATCKLWEKVKITKLKKYFLYYSLLSTFNNISIILPEILWLSVLHRGRVVMKSQYYLYFLGIIWSLPLQVINLINANMEMNHCLKSGQIRS